MNSLRLDLPGLSKSELHLRISNLISSKSQDIKNNNININQIGDTYLLAGQKNLILINYFVNARLEVFDNYLNIQYDTNAPEWTINKAINILKEDLNNYNQF